MQQELADCIVLNDTGDFTITAPNVVWDPDEKIRLFSFNITVTSPSITFKSPNLIFFATNPAVTESLTGDISTALENIDNQSFFATWYGGTIK
jgi:tRNA/tmRNA/rRNA uracil-C5-methylase (TrmA/RlmC/RlmD family)